MAQPVRGLPGRPRKHQYGWEQTIKRICISKVAYTKWKGIKEEKNLATDDAVSLYLLSLHER